MAAFAQLDDPFGVLGLCAPPPPAEAAPAAAPLAASDSCAACGGRVHADGHELVCGRCGLVAEEAAGDEGAAPPAAAGQLRLVGPGSGPLQRDLYRSSCASPSVAQFKAVHGEYLRYYQLAVESRGRVMERDALREAAELFNQLQRGGLVTRSQSKRALMAAALRVALLGKELASTPVQLAQFMQLDRKGIARGENRLRELAADGLTSVDLNGDHVMPEIKTLFRALGYEAPRFAPLWEATRAVVQAAIDANIGIDRILRSKVAGAAWCVLQRAARSPRPELRELVPRAPTLAEFCARPAGAGAFRKTTVEQFVAQLDAFHSRLERCFADLGLCAEKGAADARPKKPR